MEMCIGKRKESIQWAALLTFCHLWLHNYRLFILANYLFQRCTITHFWGKNCRPIWHRVQRSVPLLGHRTQGLHDPARTHKITSYLQDNNTVKAFFPQICMIHAVQRTMRDTQVTVNGALPVKERVGQLSPAQVDGETGHTWHQPATHALFLP